VRASAFSFGLSHHTSAFPFEVGLFFLHGGITSVLSPRFLHDGSFPMRTLVRIEPSCPNHGFVSKFWNDCACTALTATYNPVTQPTAVSVDCNFLIPEFNVFPLGMEE
jgi:hypothetical protein